MKQDLIFLDFDGVLNDPYWLTKVWPLRRSSRYKFEFDLSRLERLHLICDQTNAKLVLASSWNSRPGIREYFESMGFEVAGLLGIHENRGEAIKKWFDKFPEYSEANWIVLDDEKSDYDDEQLKHLVFTGTTCFTKWTKDNIVMSQHFIGLSEGHIDRAVSLLNNTGNTRGNKLEEE